MKSILTFIRGLFFNVTGIFDKLSPTQKISIALTLCAAIQTYADQWKPQPWMPAWFAHLWPLVGQLSSFILVYGHQIYPQATVLTPAQLQQALAQHLSSMTGQAQLQAAVTQAANSPAK